ncbi:MAG: hypothetical protein U0893_14020 [Chloroflexota bacterium]
MIPPRRSRWGSQARVANTDGQGVVLLLGAAPECPSSPAGLLEGTAVTVLEISGDE